MHTTATRRRVAAAFAAGVLSFSTHATDAFAQASETDRQIAQTLFDDGRTLMEKGRYAEACAKFAESQRLDPGGGTLLNLAVCHEKEGKTASAWTELRDALSQASRDGRKDRYDLATTHLAAIEPRLVRLTVVMPESMAARKPQVTLDRSRLPAAAWNSAIPIDPGEHVLAVVAPGSARWETTVAATTEGSSLRVEVPELERAALPPEPAQPREIRGRGTAFWITLAGGGAALTTSLVTGLMALDANAYVNDTCSTDRDFCRAPDAASEASRAKTMAWVSTATLVVGLAAVGVAFLLPLEKKSIVAVTPGGLAGTF